MARRSTSPLPLFALAGLVLVPAATALADEITFTDGGTQADCEVIEESLKQVVFTIDAGGKPIRQTREGKEVLKIVYSSEPAALTAGKAALEGGDYDGAIAQLTQAQGERKTWAKQHAGYYLGLAYLEKRDADRANQAFEALLQAFPETRFRAEARLGQVRALVLKNDMAGAQRVLAQVEAEVKERNMGAFFDVKCKLEGAKIAAATNDWRGALDRYSRVVGMATSFPAELAEARIGVAQACVETGDVNRAATELRTAIGNDTLPDSIAARAYLILGDCHKKANRPREAFFAYLRVVVLYASMSPDAPRAYYEAAKICKDQPTLGGPARATELTDELKGRFPRSEWASKR